MITHRERVQACLNGEKPDRVPVALWRHFPVDDQSPGSLAAATLNFQTTYDFDFVKVTPASSFCLKDWGVEDEWAGNSEGTRHYTKKVIHEPKDWEKLPILEPSAPHLAAQLTCLRMIRKVLGPDTPLLQTIFSPLAQAKNLSDHDTLVAHLRLYPEAVTKGLNAIAESTRRFIESAIEVGIDGVFYAIQHAQASLLTLDEYKNYGLQYDLRSLQATRSLWCNLLHLHGENIYFEIVSEFQFQIVNWHDRETAPTLKEAKIRYDGTICGGLNQDTLVYADQARVREEVKEALDQTGGNRHILGTGCVVPIIAPHGNLMAALQIER